MFRCSINCVDFINIPWSCTAPKNLNVVDVEKNAVEWAHSVGLACLPSENKGLSKFSLCSFRAADKLCAIEHSPSTLIFETDHPHDINTNLVWEIDLSKFSVSIDESSGSQYWSVGVVFDCESSTQENCATVTFWNRHFSLQCVKAMNGCGLFLFGYSAISLDISKILPIQLFIIANLYSR